MGKKFLFFNGISEADLIVRSKAGDAEAFAGLIALHKRRVYSLCLRMTGNREDAEDNMQESFLQAWRKIASFRSESAFSTWLHRLTVNGILMKWRKKGIPEQSLDQMLGLRDEDGAPNKPEPGRKDPVLTGSVDRVTLEKGIRELPPGYHTVFVLHEIDGYLHRDIAEMLGCSIGNSKSQLRKAKLKMREYLRLRIEQETGQEREAVGQ